MEEKTWVTVKVNLGDDALINVRIPFHNLHVELDPWDGIVSSNENFQRLVTTIQEVFQAQMGVRPIKESNNVS